MMIYLRSYLFLLLVIVAACTSRDSQEDGALIVSAEWLQEQMKNPSLVLLHVGTQEGYDTLHVEGALFVDPYDFTVERDELRNELPGVDSVLALLEAAGVNEDSKVVLCYESEDLITRTARVFLTLESAGWGELCYVLNGGLPGWSEKELPVVVGSKEAFTSPQGRLKGEFKKVTILAQDLNQIRWNPDYVIVDVRSAEEYYGEIDSTEMTGIRGHIEGANSMDYHKLLSDVETYLIRGDEELQAEFAKVGMDDQKTAVFYCGSGIRASLSYLVARHLGYSALLYDGSIQEWEKLELPLTSPVVEHAKNE